MSHLSLGKYILTKFRKKYLKRENALSKLVVSILFAFILLFYAPFLLAQMGTFQTQSYSLFPRLNVSENLDFDPSEPILSIQLSGESVPTVITQGSLYIARMCEGSSLRLSASASGVGTLTYTWIDLSDNSTFATGPQFDGVLPEGQYSLRVSDDEGSLTASTSIQICTVTAPPINVSLSTSGPTTLCTSGGSTNLVITANAEDPSTSVLCPTPRFNYQWFKNGQVLSSETSQSISITNQSSSAGEYAVLVSNACGSANQVSLEVETIDAAPSNVQIERENETTFICAGETLILNAQAEGSIDLFEWYRQGESSPFATGESVTVNTSGNYRLKAINGCGESTSESLNLRAFSSFSDINIISPGLNRCFSSGGVIMAINGIGNAQNIDEIIWTRDGETVAEYLFPFPEGTNYRALESGEYQVRLMNRCDEVSSPSVSAIVTKAPSFADIVASPFPSLAPNCIPPLTEITLSVDSDGNNLDYAWFFSSDNSSFSQVGDQEILALSTPGFYRVRIENDCGPFVDSEVLEVIEITDDPLSDIVLESEGGLLNTCTGSIRLSTQDAGVGVVYEWFLDGEVLTSSDEPELIATQSGIYSLIASNACGSSNPSNTLELDINLSPSDVEIQAQGASFICRETGSETLVLNAQALGSDLAFTWLRNGQVFGSGPSITLSTSGEYSLQASNTCGVASSEVLEVVFEVPPRAGQVSLVPDICTTPVNLFAQSSATNATYTWYERTGGGDIVLASGSEPNFTVSENGTYLVEVSNACRPSGVKSAPVDIIQGNTLPTPSITSLPGGVDRICPGETLRLRADAGGLTGISYRWFRENVLISEETGAEISVSESGAYRVEIFSSVSPTCSRVSLPYFVFVRPLPTVLITYQGDLLFCEGDSLVLRANSRVSPLVYNWYRESEFIQTGPSLVVKELGIYRVEAQYSSSIVGYPCEISSSQIINVQTLPRPQPVLSQAGGILSSPTQAEVYQWNLNGIPILEATEPSYVPLDSGRYSITVANELGCLGTSEEVFHPGLYLESSERVQISPNPNNGSFAIILLRAEEGRFRLFDTQGKLVYENLEPPSVNSTTGFAEVNVQGLEPGLYLLKAELDGDLHTRKVLVQ